MSVLCFMKVKAENLSSMERIAVMSMDEMSLEKAYSYDKAVDTMYKPHDKVQVVMVRGLIANWRQPIYYAFDESNVQKILLNLIESVENASYHVVALVHDLSSSNLRVWKNLEISAESQANSFKNPCADRDVY